MKIKLHELNEKMYNRINQFKILCIDLLKKNKNMLKPFLIILGILILAFYPIARANVNYIDDIGRVAKGYIEWDFFSRFVSKYVALFIHTGTYLADISPFPQVVALIILSITGCALLKLFSKEEKYSLISIIAVLPLALSPYYLECLSFKYDAPYMALSVLASVIPFLFFSKEKKGYIKFFIANIIGSLVMCMTYQASSGIVPMITIFMALNLWNDKETKEAFKLIGLSSLSYLIGLLIFQQFILVPVDDYVSTSIFSINELIPGFIANLTKYYSLVLYSLRKLWKLLIVIIIVLFFITKLLESKQNKFVAAIVSILAVAVSGCVAFGVFPALETPLFASRTMYGIGVLLSIICINTVANKKCIIKSMVVFYLCWCFFIFSFIYGNALAEQKRYEDFRIQTVIDELNDMEIMNTDDIKTINIRGSIGKAPSIENYPEGYGNMINMLISQTFCEDATFGHTYFENYFKLKNVKVVTHESDGHIEYNYVKDTMYFQIWTNSKDYILLVLK